MRRVQVIETVEGVTVLSNRLRLPEARLALTSQRVAEHEPALPVSDEGESEGEREGTEDESPRVTETHSLRALSSRTVKAKAANTGVGGLVWPFVLCVAAGAVLATLWFRKKTE